MGIVISIGEPKIRSNSNVMFFQIPEYTIPSFPGDCYIQGMITNKNLMYLSASCWMDTLRKTGLEDLFIDGMHPDDSFFSSERISSEKNSKSIQTPFSGISKFSN